MNECKYSAHDIQRFWARVDKSDQCWHWRGRKARGYGQFDVHGKCKYAHRVAYEITHGEIPEGLEILHECDNPPCCNPTHLRAGTHRENMADMVAKNRLPHRAGEQSSRAKLTWTQVREIRQRYAHGNITLRALGEEYNVHLSLISLIINNKNWQEGA